MPPRAPYCSAALLSRDKNSSGKWLPLSRWPEAAWPPTRQEGFGFASTKAGFLTVPQLGRVILEDDVEVGANTCACQTNARSRCGGRSKVST
jgi:hypothetical protein